MVYFDYVLACCLLTLKCMDWQIADWKLPHIWLVLFPIGLALYVCEAQVASVDTTCASM